MSGNSKRLANWDLLRSLAMLFVIAVHSELTIGGESAWSVEGGGTICLVMTDIFIICDPVFFMLSGYFALRPSHRSLKDYYLNKVSTIILPLILYSILFYFYACRSDLSSISLHGYFDYFVAKLTPWWFIPALIPCLIAAPFLNKGLEGLSDRGVFYLGAAIAVLSAWGLVTLFFSWLGGQIELELLVSFSNLCSSLLPPGVLLGALYYFQFFIMGGIFRRLAPYLRGKAGTWVIVFGLLFWVQDIVFSVCSIPRVDPSYSWLFTTFGIMVLFDRIKISARPAEACINWTAKRSYSIYLVHGNAMSVASAIMALLPVYSNATLPGILMAFAGWALEVLLAYVIALIIASICDTLLLANLQKLFKKLAGNAPSSLKNDKKCGVD